MQSATNNVRQLYEPAAGTSFLLDVQHPDSIDGARFETNTPIAPEHENELPYVTLKGEPVMYADGMPDGTTIRLYTKAPGTQKYTWRDGAREHGHLGSEADFKNIEATVYMRVREHNGTHTSISWILRGGTHTSSHDPHASCIGLQVPYEPYSGTEATVFRELDHPDYDFVNVKRHFDYSIKENTWVAIKAISLLDPENKRTKNYLYLDTDPFDETMSPRNEFKLYSEWEDVDGVSTGQYNQAALWAGWVTTFRVDGWKRLDVAHLSVSEINPSVV
jgi:hypothetical protein